MVKRIDRTNFVCQCGSTDHWAKGYCSKCYDKSPDRQRPERKEALAQYKLTQEWKTYSKDYMAIYRLDHVDEHNAGNRKSYAKLSINPEWLNHHNTRGYNWKDNNPKKWSKMVLKSQRKMLKKLEPILHTDQDKIPYLFRNWSKLVRQRNHDLCAIDDCFATATQSHHIFYKRYYPALSLNLNNGIGLCLTHHQEIHSRGCFQHT